jgi:hypothetical protein
MEDFAARWLVAGFTWQEAKLWLNAGIDWEYVARDYSDNGFDPTEAATWWAHRIRGLTARTYASAGFSPAQAQNILRRL